MALSYYNPGPFIPDLSTFTDEQKAGMAANSAALALYSRPTPTRPCSAA